MSASPPVFGFSACFLVHLETGHMTRGESPQLTDVPRTTWLYYIDHRWKRLEKRRKS